MLRKLVSMSLAIFISHEALASDAMTGGAWSPYLVGSLIGVLTWLTFKFSAKPIGASSAYATVAGLLGKLISEKHTLSLDYYRKHPPKFDWGLVFVLSIIVGSFIGAYSGDEFTVRWVPEMWEQSFGSDSTSSYALLAFIGGGLIAFGARLAGGCTSGHGISGTMQMSAASWVSAICFFVSGALFIQLIY